MNEIELEFAAEQINAKIREASEALTEASQLACITGLPYLIYGNEPGGYGGGGIKNKIGKKELSNKIKPSLLSMERAIANAGWSTSSWRC